MDTIKKLINRLPKTLNFFKWWMVISSLLCLSIIFILLRTVNLSNFPIFADEAIYVRWAQVMKAESTLRFLPLSDGKQPLYMWILMFIMGRFNDPLLAGRLLSVASGMGSFVGIFILSYLIFKSKKISLMSSLIYAISPFSVFFDRMALTDSLLNMFGIWTLIFSLKMAKSLRLDYSLLTGIVLGLAWLTKSPALFFTLLLPFSILITDWVIVKKNWVKNIFKYILLLLVSVVLSQGMYNILRLGPNYHLLSSRNLDYVYPLNSLFSSPLDPLIPHLRDVANWLYNLGPYPLMFLCLAGVIIGLRKQFRSVLYIMFIVIIPLLAEAIFAKVFTARYIYFLMPYIFILASVWILTKQKQLKFITFILFIFYIAISLRGSFYLISNYEKAPLPRSERSGYLEEWSAGQGIREVSVYLKDEYLKGGEKQIVVGTDGYFGTLPDGLQIYLNQTPKIIVTGVGVGFNEVPKPLLQSLASGNDTYLLVNSSRFFVKEPEKAGLQLIKEYPRAIKPDGTRESLLFFKLF